MAAVEVAYSAIRIVALTQGPSSSGAASKISPVEIGTRVDPADPLHKCLDPHFTRLAVSDISQRPRPFADCLAIDFIVTRAANDGIKWICVLVEGNTREFERMPQKLLGPSPYFVMLYDCKH